MSNIHGIGYLDTAGAYHGFIDNSGAPQICSQDYLQAVAEGDITGHTSWYNIGFTPTMTTAESDVWSAAGIYTFPSTAQQMEVVSSNNTNDIGVVIFGDATGNTVQSDAGGSTTTLVDASQDFTAGTPVAVGDIIILDPHGASPEIGYVTTVAAITLTCAGGFSSGGSGATRYYAVVDKSAHTGALVVLINWLNATYQTKREIVVLNGTTPVDTVNVDMLRINALTVVGTGTGGKPTGNLSLRNTAGTTTYSYVTAGYNASRNSAYTVPANKTLYVVQVMFSYGYAANQTHYARIYLRARINNQATFVLDNFQPFAELVCANSATPLMFSLPEKFIQKTDLKVSGIATFSGIATVAMRGWIE